MWELAWATSTLYQLDMDCVTWDRLSQYTNKYGQAKNNTKTTAGLKTLTAISSSWFADKSGL